MRTDLLLRVFMNDIINNDHIRAGHIAVYVTLCQLFGYQKYQNPISIDRHEIMLMSKIYSNTTYLKIMQTLHQQKYIIYKPNFNPYKSSQVFLVTKKTT